MRLSIPYKASRPPRGFARNVVLLNHEGEVYRTVKAEVAELVFRSGDFRIVGNRAGRPIRAIRFVPPAQPGGAA